MVTNETKWDFYSCTDTNKKRNNHLQERVVVEVLEKFFLITYTCHVEEIRSRWTRRVARLRNWLWICGAGLVNHYLVYECVITRFHEFDSSEVLHRVTTAKSKTKNVGKQVNFIN